VSAAFGMIFTTEPLHDVKAFRAVEFNWIAIEKIRHQDEIAIRRKLVSNQLHVVELVADDVCDAATGQSPSEVGTTV
jgi:hypothetical protein